MITLWWTLLVVASIFGLYFAMAVFERLAPRQLLARYWRIVNPLFRPSAGWIPGWAVLETTGRRTGRVRRVPVGGRLSGDSFWLLAGHGRKANYVLNIEADPRVRVRTRGRWRSGIAHVLADDDSRKRLFSLNPVNGLFIWIAGTELVTIRVDLAAERTEGETGSVR